MALPEGYSFTRPSDRMYSSVMPPSGMRFAYGPGGERKAVPFSNSSGGSSSGATTVNPVLGSIKRDEVISDPALRELYFGSTDTPGLINQATRAAQKTFLDQAPSLQGTAGLSAQEQQARQLAQQGIGSYQPFLNRQENLIGQGIFDLGQQRGLLGEALGGYRSAYGAQQPYLGQAEQRFGASYGAQQPYFGQAEQQLGSGLGGMFNSLGTSRNLLGQSLQGYNPGMANQYYNPFEDQVVNQTIEDMMKAGDMRDIQQRASDISQGGESAFGSRARLTADERRESLGRGLGKALGQIRSGGFDTAQSRALQELENQRTGARSGATLEAGFGAQGSDAQRQYAQDLMGLGRGRSDLERQYGQDLLNIGDTRGSLQRQLAGDITGVGSGIAGIGANLAGYGSDLGALGATQQRLRDQDIGTLTTLGATDRGIEQEMLNRQYKQQEEQRMAPANAAKFIQQFAPQYQGSKTTVNKTYGMPRDPRAEGLAAAINTYTQLAGNNQRQPQGGTAPAPTPAPTPASAPAQNYSLQTNAQSYFAPGQAGQFTQFDINNPYAAPTGTGYQGGPVNTQGAFNSGTYNPGYQPQQQAPGYQAPAPQQPGGYYLPSIKPAFNQNAIQSSFNQGSYGSMNPPPPINIGAGFNSNQYNPLNPNPYQPGQINYGPRG